ncbi:hypothetical protein QYE76_056827 [Lolium multiflorum]|uniref:Uncharacterized protein n=1 Tax=Lolium multiflorum TaxID=4521 RepID=A0AAD8T2F9_LOLMU|nr:hypothetical protein QYE76_056827 [Lolium multiflorum]
MEQLARTLSLPRSRVYYLTAKEMHFKIMVTLRASSVERWIHGVKRDFLDAAPIKLLVGLDCEFSDHREVVSSFVPATACCVDAFPPSWWPSGRPYWPCSLGDRPCFLSRFVLFRPGPYFRSHLIRECGLGRRLFFQSGRGMARREVMEGRIWGRVVVAVGRMFVETGSASSGQSLTRGEIFQPVSLVPFCGFNLGFVRVVSGMTYGVVLLV